MINLNELQYGNPPLDAINYITNVSYLDDLFASLSLLQYPANDSHEVKLELIDLTTKIIQLQADAEILKRYKTYDFSLYNYLSKLTFDNEDDKAHYQATLKNIFEDILPIIFKLKIHFQRPRPWQLAWYLNTKLYPFQSYSSDSPSFPSLHACVGVVIGHVFSKYYPDSAKFFLGTADDIGFGRLYMGLNFESDVEAGVSVAKSILSHSTFKAKYNL